MCEEIYKFLSIICSILWSIVQKNAYSTKVAISHVGTFLEPIVNTVEKKNPTSSRLWHDDDYGSMCECVDLFISERDMYKNKRETEIRIKFSFTADS